MRRAAKLIGVSVLCVAPILAAVWLWPTPQPELLPGEPKEALVPGDNPHYVTPGGIPVYVVGTPPIPPLPLVGIYLDAAEEALRAVGIKSALARVFIWAPHTLNVDRDGDGKVDVVPPEVGIVLGATKFKQPDAGLSVVWFDYPRPEYGPDGNRIGAVAYAHERMHHAGWGERAIRLSPIDDFASDVAEDALRGALAELGR